jgi:alpha-L-arabinofuranosidase
MADYETLRHFVLWAKGHYPSKEIEDIICKITASSNPVDVRYDSKLYWLLETCKYYKIDGYSIINQFLEMEGRIMYESENKYEQMIDSMKVRLQIIKVWSDGSTIWDLGEPDLFTDDESEV